MTTPSVDLNIAMPYGVTVEGDGDVKPRIVTRSPKASENDNLALPNGPCRVTASWEGSETVHLYVYVPGRGTFRRGTIPAGGGCAPSWFLSEPRQASGSFSKALQRFLSALAARSRSTRWCPSSSAPRQGGGVGDHPEPGRGLRRVADDYQLRRIYYGWKRLSHWGGQLLSAAAGGCFYLVGVGPADWADGAPDHRGGRIHPVRHPHNDSGGDTRAVEYRGAARRNPIPSHSGGRCGGRRRHDYHLATRPVVTTGGGCAK